MLVSGRCSDGHASAIAASGGRASVVSHARHGSVFGLIFGPDERSPEQF